MRVSGSTLSIDEHKLSQQRVEMNVHGFKKWTRLNWNHEETKRNHIISNVWRRIFLTMYSPNAF